MKKCEDTKWGTKNSYDHESWVKVFAEIVQQIVMMISNWLFLFHIASKLVQYVAILLGHSKMDIAL